MIRSIINARILLKTENPYPLQNLMHLSSITFLGHEVLNPSIFKCYQKQEAYNSVLVIYLQDREFKPVCPNIKIMVYHPIFIENLHQSSSQQRITNVHIEVTSIKYNPNYRITACTGPCIFGCFSRYRICPVTVSMI